MGSKGRVPITADSEAHAVGKVFSIHRENAAVEDLDAQTFIAAYLR
jgi:hypothetical protein